MALAGQRVGSTGTYLDDALRTHYQDAIREQFPKKSVLLSNVEKGDARKIDTYGNFARITLQKSLHPSVGAKAEGGSLPAKDYTRLETTDVSIKYNYGRVEFSGPSIRASRDTRGALMQVSKLEMKAVTDAMRNDINRQLASGDGTGKLALINGASQTTTWTLDSLLGRGFTTGTETTPTKYLSAGMRVDIGDATTYTTIDVSAATVTTVDSSTQITGTTISGHDDNGFVMRAGAAASEMMGLAGIVDDGGQLDTLQTITRSTAGNSYWKSSVVDKGSVSAPAELQESDMQSAASLIEKNDGELSFVLTTYALRDKYASILQSDKRYVNTIELQGGFKSLEFNGVALTPDKDCVPFNMFFVDKSTLELYEMAPISWMQDDGAILNRVADLDAYEATLFYYANLGANNCVRNACLSYVQ